MIPNLVDHLTTFVRIADTGNFSAAARDLGRAVSSVSYSVAQLETYCGFRLLDRTSKRAKLTERGRALYAEAQAVIKNARRFEAHASVLERGEETRIRIAVDVLFPLAPLHAALDIFARTHERARLQFFTRSLNTLWADLKGGRIDFALGLLDTIPTDMEGRSFGEIGLLPVASSNHRLARREGPLSLSDFEGERQIYFIGSPELDLEHSGRTFSSDIWTASDLEHVRLLVRDGFGWCFATDHFFEPEIRQGLIKPLACLDVQLHPSRMLGAVWPAAQRLGPLSRMLIDLTEDALPAETRAAPAGAAVRASPPMPPPRAR